MGMTDMNEIVYHESRCAGWTTTEYEFCGKVRVYQFLDEAKCNCNPKRFK